MVHAQNRRAVKVGLETIKDSLGTVMDSYERSGNSEMIKIVRSDRSDEDFGQQKSSPRLCHLHRSSNSSCSNNIHQRVDNGLSSNSNWSLSKPTLKAYLSYTLRRPSSPALSTVRTTARFTNYRGTRASMRQWHKIKRVQLAARERLDSCNLSATWILPFA